MSVSFEKNEAGGRWWLFCSVLTLLYSLVASVPVNAATSDTPIDWSNFSYADYTYLGGLVTDFESSSDPSNGGAAVAPSSLDIASCSPDATNPGGESSTRIAYYDDDGDSGTLNDAFMAFGIRIDGNPLNGGQERGYVNNHWNILIDIDNDGYKEFVIDLNGNFSGSQPDRFFLRYNNDNTQEIDTGTDTLDEWYASGPGATGEPSDNNHTRVVVSNCGADTDYWVDFQIPLTAFNVATMQLIGPSTPVRIFYSSSASNTNPLQKDWMMDPDGLSDTFMVTDPIVFGDIYSGTGGVEPLNNPPMAMDDLAGADPNVPINIDVLANDSDADGDPLTITSVTVPGNGSAVIDTMGTPSPADDEITYTADPGFSGMDTFMYTVDDGNGGSATASVTVTVPVSMADVAVDLSVDDPTPTVGDTVTFTVQVDNAGPDAATVQVTDLLPDGYSYVGDSGGGDYDSVTGEWSVGVVGSGMSAVLTISATVNASGDYTNTATITGLDVSDPVPGNNSDSVATTPNNPPMAMDDLAGADPNVPINIDVLANDSDADGDPLTITAVTVPGNGSAVIDTMGTPNPADDEITYTADPGFSGVDTFMYTVEDPNGDTATATVSVTVPLASADVSVDLSVDDPTPTVGTTVTFTVQVDNAGPDAATVQVTDLLPDGYSYVGDSGGGDYDSVTGEWDVGVVPTGMSAVLTISATVNASGDYTNTATITSLDVSDPVPGNNSDSVATTPNNPPMAMDDLAGADPNVPINIDVLANDSDADGDPLTITAVTVPGNGSAVIDTMGTPNPADDEITYTADPGFSGVDTFMYTVEDPNGDTATASVSVTVPLASADVAVDLSVDDPAPSVGDTVTFTVQVDNAGPDAATVQVTDLLPDGYSYVGDSGGGDYDSVTGEWDVGVVPTGMSAVLTISATVNASGDYTNTATITGLDVSDPVPGNNSDSVATTPNAPPTAVDDLAGADPNVPINIDVLANDSDADGDPLTITAVTVPGNGSAVIDTMGTPNPADDEITYTADPGFSGVDTFTYTVEDPNGDSDTATVSVTVPLASADVAVDLSVDDPTPTVGDTVTFTVQVDNAGPDTATVQVTDLLPDGYSYVGDSGGGDYDSVTGVWDVGVVGSGMSAVLTISATVNASGDYTNTATITGLDVSDPVPGNNSDSVAVTAPMATADVAVDLSVDDPTPSVGDTVTFTVQVDNAGPDTATVQVTDLLPDGYSYVGDSGGGDYDSVTGVWDVGVVGSGMSAVLTISATVNASGDYTNTATITGLNATDPDTGNNQSSISITLGETSAPQAIPLFGLEWILLLSGWLVIITQRHLSRPGPQ